MATFYVATRQLTWVVLRLQILREAFVAFYFSPFEPIHGILDLLKKCYSERSLSPFAASKEAIKNLCLFCMSWLMLVQATFVCVVFVLKYLPQGSAFRHDTAIFAVCTALAFVRYAVYTEGPPFGNTEFLSRFFTVTVIFFQNTFDHLNFLVF